MSYSWTPASAHVAAYVTSRTVNYADPGSDNPVGDFTATTYPTLTQVNQLIQDACAWVAAEVGSVIDPGLDDQATAAASLRAAALVELSYPIRDADVSSTAGLMFEQAESMRRTLALANAAATGSNPDSVLPSYSFPDPVWWGDRNI